MSSFLFLAAIVAVVWLVYWVFHNDAYGFKGGLKGLFAMRERPAGAKRKSFTPKWKQQDKPRADRSKRRW
ncbi:MAG TPA: hypothetical protein VHC40_00805 [Rhizomicrobium sp.]|jgi:hypothetical protein|nr:hypothetical protein [Rhizomicrobium sp.]